MIFPSGIRNMRTKLCLWVLGLATALIASRAQAPAPAAPTPPAQPPVAAATNNVPRVPSFVMATNIAPASGREVVAEIRYNGVPLGELIGVLAEQAGVQFQLDPNATEVTGRLVNFSAQNVSAAAALDTALLENRMVLIKDPTTGAIVITPRDSQIAQAVAAAGPTTTPVDLDQEPEANTTLQQLADQGGEVPVIQALQMMARLSNMSIQFDPQVRTGARRIVGTNVLEIPSIATNTVNLADFRDVTAQQAMEAILENHGLMMMPNQRTGVNTVTFKDPTAKEPMFTHVLQLKYSNPTNMIPILQGTLGDPRSRVTPNARTGQLIIYSTQRELGQITNLVEQIDIPTKQVLIEARLVETSRNPSSIKGIDWSPTLQAQNISFGNGVTTGETETTIPGTTTGGTTPNGRPTGGSGAGHSAQTILNTAVGAGIGGISMDTTRGFYPNTAFLNADGVRAVLSFLNSDNESDLVSTPRAVMLDNQTAVLAVTRAFPIFEVTPGSANSPAGARVTYTNLGTILTVTPRIAADSNVALKVVPEVSDIVAKDRQTINGLVNEANVYAIRKIETEVNIPSGHTLVMGGLTSDSSTRDYTKVPLLGDIPGIGRAFRRDSKSKRKLNLIVFITPTIIEDGDFHVTSTEFLQQKPVILPEEETSAWDSGKPKQWRKKKEATP